ncbi:MAG: MerR family DNA-binding transcriptional regulator [Oceanospirillaceae bacterium]|nr:MerR family DNA-binding transcriptional regulator [Oceanospirillaceae bacterium]
MYISAVSKLSGLSAHTLCYYEKQGLLKNIYRNNSARRVYSDGVFQGSWHSFLKFYAVSRAC